MILKGAMLGCLATGLCGGRAAAQAPRPVAGIDQAAAARRLAATAQLAAQEYRIGVEGGRIIAKAEVDEARLFLQEARRSAALLPPDVGRGATRTLDSLLAMVAATAAADSLDAGVHRLASGVAAGLGIVLDEIPAESPSLARGAQVYQANCASCHGALGAGDGPMAASLDPKPADLTASSLRDQSPLDFYRRITIGVVGTSMPAFESRLPAEDRWAAALYASVLRLPAAAGDVPASLRAFATTGRMSDDALIHALGEHGAGPVALGHVARVRSFQADASAAASAAVFARVRSQVESTYALARQGDSSASSRAFDAYMTFEQVERSVRAKNPGLATDLEAAFAALRSRAAGGATAAELTAIRAQLYGDLEKAERVLGDDLSPANLFLQSFVILVREGLEAILIVGALMTFLVKMGAAQRKRDVNVGVGAAVGASVLTAIALETIFQITPARREALEGATMVVATGVLFYVSYWLLSKMEVAKWNHFVKSKVQDAVTSGSALALASAAFLAVYREGFETILFYKALFVSGGPGGAMPVVGGMVAGSVVMVGVYLAINRFGIRLPLKPFFGFTSAFLYYMAFVFAGKGIAELQEGGLVGTTILPAAPRIPALGIYPTLESLAAQALLLVLALAALAWTFVIVPRRLRVAQVMVPGAAALRRQRLRRRPTPVASQQSGAPGAGTELLRSLERMEADLAELRAEVERMKGHVTVAGQAR